MYTIAIMNQSGGVGKTTAAHNLAHALSTRGRTLVIDLDPQASLTRFIGAEGSGPYAWLTRNGEPPIAKVSENLDLARSGIELAFAERELQNALVREYRLKKRLAELKDYEFTVIDCPPSLGLLSILALIAADAVLVPIGTQFKSYMGTDLFLKTIDDIRREANRDLRVLGFLPTLYDRRTSHQRQILDALVQQLEPVAPVFDPLPYSTAFPDASVRNLPLALYRPAHPSVKTFDTIAESAVKTIARAN